MPLGERGTVVLVEIDRKTKGGASKKKIEDYTQGKTD